MLIWPSEIVESVPDITIYTQHSSRIFVLERIVAEGGRGQSRAQQQAQLATFLWCV